MISVAEAHRLIREGLTPLDAEPTSLEAMLGRVLAEQLFAGDDLPPFANSAMDGFAVRSVDAATAPVRLAIVGEVSSGRVWERSLDQGQALRIMTGAPIPPGADAVVKVEDTKESDDHVDLEVVANAGDHIRPIGEDLRKGALVLEAGTVLTPVRVGMVAALGCSMVLTVRPPRVAILSTGDELVDPGKPLGPGQIRNSNAYGLFAYVLASGAIPIPLGVCPDDYDRTLERLEAALDVADVVITSGGVSMGRYDHVGKALAALGEVKFTRVAQQPGKPLTFAMAAGKPVFGLPGNPVSTMVNFEIFVRPALRLLMGHVELDRPRERVRLGETITKSAGKAFHARVVVADGVARLTGPQGSGMWNSLGRADALALLPAEADELTAGAEVEIIRLS